MMLQSLTMKMWPWFSRTQVLLKLQAIPVIEVYIDNVNAKLGGGGGGNKCEPAAV